MVFLFCCSFIGERFNRYRVVDHADTIELRSADGTAAANSGGDFPQGNLKTNYGKENLQKEEEKKKKREKKPNNIKRDGGDGL